MTEKYMPEDGQPVDMSEFTLGKRYSAEDMYRDYPDLKVGDRVAVEKDGVVYTDTITAVEYKSPEWVAPPKRTLWQRVVRKLTPARFRKPLPQSPPRPGRVTVKVGVQDPMKRSAAVVAETLAAMEQLTDPKP